MDPKENTVDNDEGVSARDDDRVWLPALVWMNAVAMDLRMRACKDMMICLLIYYFQCIVLNMIVFSGGMGMEDLSHIH